MFRVSSQLLASHDENQPHWQDEAIGIEVVGRKPFFMVEVEQLSSPYQRTTRILVEDINELNKSQSGEGLRLISVDMVFAHNNGYQIRRIRQVWQKADGGQLFVFDDGSMRGNQQLPASFMDGGLTLVKELPEMW